MVQPWSRSVTMSCSTENSGRVTWRLHVNEYFYGNTPADEGDVTRAIRDGDHINLIGEQAVGIAIGLGLVERSGCLVIEGVPHAQIIRV